MGVHYDRGFVGLCKDNGVKPITIALGSDIVLQTGVDTKYQLAILGMMQEIQDKFPPDQLKPKATEPAAGEKETSSESATKPPEVADKKDDMRQHKKNRRETLAGQTGAEEGNR